MFESRSIAAIAIALALAAPSAEAATVVNLDLIHHRLVIVEDDVRHEMLLEAQTGIEGFCEAGCQIYINNDAQSYQIAGSDIIEIRDGEFYRIEPEPETDPAPDDGATPRTTPIVGD